MANNLRIGAKKICAVSPDRIIKERLDSEAASTPNVEVDVVEKSIVELAADTNWSNYNSVIIDLQECALEKLEAFQLLVSQLDATTSVLVLIDNFDPGTMRVLLQMKISDFVLKSDQSVIPPEIKGV